MQRQKYSWWTVWATGIFFIRCPRRKRAVLAGNPTGKVIQTAAKRAGIQKIIGWHTFRHTYSTLLAANGENLKVVQELMRHAKSCTTLDLYTQAK